MSAVAHGLRPQSKLAVQLTTLAIIQQPKTLILLALSWTNYRKARSVQSASFTLDAATEPSGSVIQLTGAGPITVTVNESLTSGTVHHYEVINSTAAAATFCRWLCFRLQVTQTLDAGKTALVRVVNDAAFVSSIQGGAGDGNILQNDLTADAAHTQSFADFGQTWNNLQGFTVNQEFAAFPGNFGSTDWTTASFDITAQGAPGVQGVYNFNPGGALIDISTGTEDRTLELGTTKPVVISDHIRW